MAPAEIEWQQLEQAYRVKMVPLLSAHMVDDLMTRMKPIYLKLWRPPLSERILLRDVHTAEAESTAIEAAQQMMVEYAQAAMMEIMSLLATAYTEKWAPLLPEPPQTRQ